MSDTQQKMTLRYNSQTHRVRTETGSSVIGGKRCQIKMDSAFVCKSIAVFASFPICLAVILRASI